VLALAAPPLFISYIFRNSSAPGLWGDREPAGTREALIAYMSIAVIENVLAATDSRN